MTPAERGEIIKQTRERLGLSKAAAAHQAGISATTWRLIEKGNPPMVPTPATLVSMAKTLGLDATTWQPQERPTVELNRGPIVQAFRCPNCGHLTALDD